MKKAAKKKTIAVRVIAPPVDAAVVNELALEHFEALSQSQPHPVPWTPVTDYSAEARRLIEEHHAALIVETFAPSRVLDAGCGFGYLVNALVARGVDTHGYDSQRYPSWPSSYRFGFGELDTARGVCPFRGPFDLIVCREVLEHLTLKQIRPAVSNLCKWTSRYVYLTTRFHPNPKHFLDVATSDNLDPTHITMLNQDLLRALFVLEGFKRRADLEERMDHRKCRRVLVYKRCEA